MIFTTDVIDLALKYYRYEPNGLSEIELSKFILYSSNYLSSYSSAYSLSKTKMASWLLKLILTDESSKFALKLQLYVIYSFGPSLCLFCWIEILLMSTIFYYF